MVRAADQFLPGDSTPKITQPLVWTDKADYAPGETVTVFGMDFAAGESVSLQITFADGRATTEASHQPWTTTADAGGVLSSQWLVTPDCFGALLLLTAKGTSSGRVAAVLFTDSTGLAPTPGEGIAWGYGWYGQLGNGLFYNSGSGGSASSVSISALPGGRKLAAVAARDYSTLALASDNTLWTWGYGNYGLIGNGSIAHSATPVAVNPLPDSRVAIAVSNGFYHDVALASDGRIVAWGQGMYGQLGNGARTDSAVPILANELPAGRKAVRVASGGYHNVALADDGTLWAWGYGYYGNLGNGTFYTAAPNCSPLPVPVSALPGGRVPIAVAAGNHHSLALASDGTLWAWGLGMYGSLGNGVFYSTAPYGSAVPVQVTPLPGGRTIAAISAGGYHTLVLATDNTLWTWGYGAQGQLGTGATANSAVPVQVAALPGGRIPTRISAGANHNLVLANDNSLWAWGYGGNGQLGNGAFANSSVPVACTAVVAPQTITGIAAGAHNVAIVGSVNSTPTASAQSVSTLEDLPVVIALAGTDPDGQPLTYSIATYPAHGSLSWTPNLTYTPATNYNGPDSFTFTVSNAGGATSSPAAVSITVTPMNDAPNLANPGNKTVAELSTLSFVLAATDVENDLITYSISAGAVSGMGLNPATGIFTWTPDEAQGPGTYNVTFRATDNGSPAKIDEETIVITVTEVNTAPVLASPGDMSVSEQTPLAFTLSATDADLPSNTLTFSISSGAVAGMSLNSSTGAFSWTPSEAQGPGTYSVTFRVTDNGTPALSHEQTVRLSVGEVNLPPSLLSPGNQSTAWGNEITFALIGSDPDLPANALTYSIDAGALPGMALNGNAFSWTPSANQIGTANVTFRVTDSGGLSATQTIAIEVGRRATALVYDGDASAQYSDQPNLSARLTDAGGGPLNGTPIVGETIGFTLGAQGASAVTNILGCATAKGMALPTLPATYNVVCAFSGRATSPYLASSSSAVIGGVTEDAAAFYSGVTYFSTGGADSPTARLTLTGTAIDATDDGRGDIRKATVEFHRDAPDGPLLGSANLLVGLVDVNDPTVGVATTPSFDYTLSSSEQNAAGATLNVYTVVKGWYNGVAGPDVVTIAIPGSDSVSAGGFLTLGNSAGELAGDAGSKCSIGCTMKFNKSGRNSQGQVNIIFRKAGHVYHVKSNAIDSLATSGDVYPKQASVVTKATLTDVTDPAHPITVAGNLNLQLELSDGARGGGSDEIAITLTRSSGGLLFSSSWDGNRTSKQMLTGGNVAIE